MNIGKQLEVTNLEIVICWSVNSCAGLIVDRRLQGNGHRVQVFKGTVANYEGDLHLLMQVEEN